MRDGTESVKKCRACQLHCRKIHQPAQVLQTTPLLSWPFMTWGLDLLGPFPMAPSGFKFLIVAINTFTKWIEAKPPVRTITMVAIDFVQSHIFARVRVPGIIIMDNGS